MYIVECCVFMSCLFASVSNLPSLVWALSVRDVLFFKYIGSGLCFQWWYKVMTKLFARWLSQHPCVFKTSAFKMAYLSAAHSNWGEWPNRIAHWEDLVGIQIFSLENSSSYQLLLLRMTLKLIKWPSHDTQIPEISARRGRGYDLIAVSTHSHLDTLDM